MVRVVQVVRLYKSKRVQFLYSFCTHPPSGQYDVECVQQELNINPFLLLVYISELQQKPASLLLRMFSQPIHCLFILTSSSPYLEDGLWDSYSLSFLPDQQLPLPGRWFVGQLLCPGYTRVQERKQIFFLVQQQGAFLSLTNQIVAICTSSDENNTQHCKPFHFLIPDQQLPLPGRLSVSGMAIVCRRHWEYRNVHYHPPPPPTIHVHYIVH